MPKKTENWRQPAENTEIYRTSFATRGGASFLKSGGSNLWERAQSKTCELGGGGRGRAPWRFFLNISVKNECFKGLKQKHKYYTGLPTKDATSTTTVVKLIFVVKTTFIYLYLKWKCFYINLLLLP